MNALAKNLVLMPVNLLYRISPKLCLKVLFRIKQGYRLNLDEPQTYNEKIQWLKLYYRNPLMPICCDKYLVRGYVSERGYEHLLNKLYWDGFDPEEIPYDSLPEKFVIKVTHGSTFNIIEKDKSSLDRKATTAKLNRWLRAKFIPCYGEWFYGKAKPRIIIEKYLENECLGQLYDYKVFCFNGKARYVRMDVDRFTNHTAPVYDTKWNRRIGCDTGYAAGSRDFPRPECLDEMLLAAEDLSSPFPHARVDFYVVENRPVFGEITFTNGAGFDRFHPDGFDREMGDWLELPKRNNNE